jgi:4-amino-4-deoxy-L-arabinose transferase-like glycosyltransferase
MFNSSHKIRKLMWKRIPLVNFFLLIICPLTAFAMVVLVIPEGANALLLVTFSSLFAILLIRIYSDDRDFLTKVFLFALCVRILLGTLIESFGLLKFFGGDSIFYDEAGYRIVQLWYGTADSSDYLSEVATSIKTPGWGINYLVAIIYFIFGRSVFIAQSFCSVIGAAISPMIYFCAKQLYDNRRVARISALFIAFFPTFIVWSAQLLKDGLIVFLIVLAITMAIFLQKRFSLPAIICLIFSLFGILSLRFYIFYMVGIGVFLGFIIGINFTFNSLIRRVIAIIILGVSLTYIGVIETAVVNYDAYADIEKLQSGRQFSARYYNSGFGKDFDVSTMEGALSALPIGLAYLLFAPFPWQINNFRQAITLPEVLVWWSLMPLLVSGIWFTLKTRLRKSIPVIVFTLMLTIAYALFQSEVGTAYRHRTQIQVFLFMFIAVGWTLMLEKKEILLIHRLNRYRRFLKKSPINIKQKILSPKYKRGRNL